MGASFDPEFMLEATRCFVLDHLAGVADIASRGGDHGGAAEANGYDYVLRFFGPRVGVAEDMVTGTAHCALAPYWRDKLRGRDHFIAFQVSPRGGFVHVRLVVIVSLLLAMRSRC